MRALLKLLLSVALLISLLLVIVHWRYAGGEVFPDRTGIPEMSSDALEVVANLDFPPGNIAVSSTGRIFATLHPEARPDVNVVEIVDGKPQPWPNMAFQDGIGERRYFRDVLSLRIDRQGRLWTLDNGFHGKDNGRLLAFDTATGEVVHEYTFPRSIAGLGSHLNDFQVMPNGHYIFIADASFFAKTPAIIVYDVRNKVARRVLEGHESVEADDYAPVVQGRKMTAFGLVTIRPGVDSIALDRIGEWLYFAPVTDEFMHRIRSEDLLDLGLSADMLSARVERFARKTMSDGITTDRKGNIFISDLEHSSIVMLGQDRKLRTLIKSDKLRWPDGFSFGPDGWLYVTCSSLHQVIGLPPSSVKQHAPYQIYRFKAPHPGIAGH